MATIKDIANKLGISPSTVSKGLNGAHDISDEMRSRVLDAAIELGYASKKIKSRKNLNLCILINEIELPKLDAGDVLCVYNTGAYNYSMASNYNRVERPAMVLVNNSHSDIIVYRETLDDLISKDNIPDRLR